MNNNNYLYTKLEEAFKSEFKERKNILEDIVRILKENLLVDYVPSEDGEYRSLEGLFEAVCSSNNVSKELVRSKDRRARIVAVRHFFCYMVQQKFQNNYPLKEIGAVLGNRDHTTIINSQKMAKIGLDNGYGLITECLRNWKECHSNS